MSQESPLSSDNEWDEWEIINLQTQSVIETKPKKAKQKDVENLTKEIRDQLSISQKEEKMKLEELSRKLNEQTQISEAKLQEITSQLQSIVKLQQITQLNHQETNAKLQEANNKLKQIEDETKKRNNQFQPVLPLQVPVPVLPTTIPFQNGLSKTPPSSPLLTSIQQRTNLNNDYSDNNHHVVFVNNKNVPCTQSIPNIIDNNTNTNFNLHNNDNNNDNKNISNHKNDIISILNNGDINKDKNINTNVNVDVNVNIDNKSNNKDTKNDIVMNVNDLKLKCVKNIGEAIFEPNEKRQCGWILTNKTKSKMKLKGHLKKLTVEDMVSVKTQKFYEFEISPNEEIQLLFEVVAPIVVGKYCLFYQFVSETDTDITDVLELTVEVKSKLSKEKEDMIASIVNMGFNDRNKIIYSLQRSNWNIQEAINHFLIE